MPTENNIRFDERQFKSSGEVACYLYAAGILSSTAYDMGYIDDFTLSGPKVASEERISKRRSDYGQKIKVVMGSKTQEGKLVLTDFNADNLNMAFLGESALINNASGTVADEEVIVKKGQLSRLAHRLVSDVVVESLATGGITYDAGTDYEVDVNFGFIRIPENSTIPDGSVFVSYSHAAEKGFSVKADVKKIIEAKLVFSGRDLARDNRLVEITIHKANLVLSGDLPIIADKMATLELKVDVLAVNNESVTYVEIEG